LLGDFEDLNQVLDGLGLGVNSGRTAYLIGGMGRQGMIKFDESFALAK
jgi:hypothetical protein